MVSKKKITRHMCHHFNNPHAYKRYGTWTENSITVCICRNYHINNTKHKAEVREIVKELIKPYKLMAILMGEN